MEFNKTQHIEVFGLQYHLQSDKQNLDQLYKAQLSLKI